MTEPTDPSAQELPGRHAARPLLGMPDPADPRHAHTQELARTPAARPRDTSATTPYGVLGAEVYPPQPDADAPWPLVSGQPPRPRRRLGAVLLGLLIVLVVGGLTAAFVILGPIGDRGAGTPAQAVDGFLEGIYGLHSPKDAARFVCERARSDAELEQIIFQVRQLEDSYSSARTSWNYPPIEEQGRQASAQVTLTMITANEQLSTRTVTLQLVNDRGWWVCDVSPAEQAAG